MQVFFCPDVVPNDWRVVLQKEARSKRIEAELYDAVLGAPGRPVHVAEVMENVPINLDQGGGEQVPEAHVAVVNADEQAQNQRQYNNLDFVDEDDDDDIQVLAEADEEDANVEEEEVDV